MEMQPSQAERSVQRHGEAPGRIIKLILLMAVGIGLACVLILKMYMLILTDFICVSDSNTLGNLIRCTSLLGLSANGLALAAGIELAYLLFAGSILACIKPLILALSSATLLLLSDPNTSVSAWQSALFLTALTASLVTLLWGLNFFGLMTDAEIKHPNRDKDH